MVQLFEKSLIFRFIIAFMSVSSVCLQCCDFSNYPCSWDQASWTMSSATPPNLNLYPNFAITEPDPYFLYLQDWSGSTSSLTTFSIPSDGTVITFDYFLDSPTVDTNTYFYVEFYNNDDFYSTWLLTINTPSATWQHAQLTCNSNNNYCCGSTYYLPCEGTLRIIANVGFTHQALFAIDNIGTTCSSALTTPPPPTTPPPQPTHQPLTPTHYDCCFFYQHNCEAAGDWRWSKENRSIYIPNIHDYFEWTDVDGATWYSPLQSNVNTSTLFTLNYFMWSAAAQLALAFKDSSGVTYDLGLLTYSKRSWLLHSFNCSTCCGTSTNCDGQLTITSNIPDQTQVAIDTVGQYSSCYGAFTCCLFNDPFVCGCESESQDGYQWLFSGDKYPTHPVPSLGSGFVYFEVVNSFAPFRLALRTELTTIHYYDNIEIQMYTYDSYYAYHANSFLVTFHNVGRNYTLILWDENYANGYWETFAIYGNDICITCTGYFEFVMDVKYVASDVVYAIDYIEIGKDSCGGHH